MTEHQPGSREWAEAEARKGAKVRHESWGPNGWISYHGDLLLDEIGERLEWRPGAFLTTGWSIYEPAPDLAARVAELRDTDMRTVLDAIAGVSARVAVVRKAFDTHFHHPDTGECYWHNPPVTGQAKVDLSAPDFTTSDTPSTATEEALAEIAAGRVTRHETFADLMADLNGPDDPAPGVMTDDEIIRAGYVQGDVNASMANAIRLTRASIRAQLAANEAGAVKEGVGLIEYSLTALEDAIAAALKAHKEGV